MTGTLGFTGTQYTSGFHSVIRDALDVLEPFDRYVTGACVGFDTLAGAYMALTRPEAEHVVLVPSNRYKVHEWWTEFPNVIVVEMAEDTDFKDRNQEIVNRSDVLMYCALFPEDHGASRRSGTWQTIRMARRKPIPTHRYSLTLRRDA